MSASAPFKIEWSRAARDDLERLMAFLHDKNPTAARDVALVLIEATDLLLLYPDIGRKNYSNDDRDLIVSCGKSGYIMRYRVQLRTIIIVRIWHGVEQRD